MRRNFLFLAVESWVLALCFLPPVFERLFAILPMPASSGVGLFLCSGFFVLVGFLFFLKRSPKISWLWVGVLQLVAVEMVTRVTINRIVPHGKRTAAQRAIAYYPEYWRYRGHPFLQLTGNPNYLFDPGWVNERGFPGKSRPLAKPANTVRIAAVGSSTTTSGYPRMLESFLEKKNLKTQFEVLNFGGDGYTSAHSLIAFLLVALDYDPDYVVFHNGANDGETRNAGTHFRGDYAHAFRSFVPPVSHDLSLLRLSVLYREVDRWLNHREPRRLLDEVTRHARSYPDTKPPYADLSELAPYRRNVRNFIEVALANGVYPILTTEPRSTRPEIKNAYLAKPIDQANAILRELANRYQKKTVLVDLDQSITGKKEPFFLDIAHTNDVGNQFKAEAIGNVILAHWQSKRLSQPSGADHILH